MTEQEEKQEPIVKEAEESIQKIPKEKAQEKKKEIQRELKKEKGIQQKKEKTEPLNRSEWYNKNYKILLLIPVIILVISIAYLGIFYSKNHDFFDKDVSLSGGTSITINGEVSQIELEPKLKEKFPDVSFTRLSELVSQKQIALVIESTASQENLKSEIESILGYELTEENSTIEFTGALLGQDFYKQLIFALVISFSLMSIVIFVLFRTFIPSTAVIFAAFADIVMSLAFVNFLDIKLSAAGIAAFLMLIGYSVDTDILLTSRALKSKEGSLNKRIFGAFKTGILMTLTALAAVLPAFFLVTGLPGSFRQIFLILAIGLVADIFNTWLTNASIIKWYCNKKQIK